MGELPYLVLAAVEASVGYKWPKSFRWEIFSSVLQLRFCILLPCEWEWEWPERCVCIALIGPHGCALEQQEWWHMIQLLLYIPLKVPVSLFLDAYCVCCLQHWCLDVFFSNSNFNTLPCFGHLGFKNDKQGTCSSLLHPHILYCHAAPTTLQQINHLYHSVLCFITNDKLSLFSVSIGWMDFKVKKK